MTTLWARLKIWKAFENGEITEECAQYFDELLNNNKYVTVQQNIITLGHHSPIITQSEYAHLNGKNEYCVLGSIGSVDNQFNVMEYIKQTTFKNGKYFGGYGTAYMANVIGQDFVGLDSYINEELTKNKLSVDSWKKIKKYLEETYEICAKTDVGRKNYVLILIKEIKIKIKTLYLKQELESLETNPPKDVDADVINHNIATIRTKIENLEN